MSILEASRKLRKAQTFLKLYDADPDFRASVNDKLYEQAKSTVANLMKFIKTIIPLLVIAFLSGCASYEKRIPLVNAEHFEYHSGGIMGTTSTDLVVTNVKVTETSVEAESVEFQSTLPLIGVTRVTIKGYHRDRTIPPQP